MHQCFFYFHTGLIHRTEIFLANSARWTNPIFWKIFKCCTWLYAILWVADSWVIHPTADITYVFLHSHIVLIVICCKYTHYTSNDKAKRVKVLLIYNNYNSVYYLWETLLCKKLLFCETSYTPVDLCKSVQSVGELFWLRGVYHPTEQTGRGCSPTDFTDSHRWCVFGILRILRSVGIQFSHGLHRSTQMVGCVSSPTESTELTEVWLR